MNERSMACERQTRRGLVDKLRRISGVSRQQTGSGVAFTVVPDLLCGVELRGIRGKLLHVETGMGLADTLDGRPPVNRAAVPEQEARTSEMAQEGSEALRDIDSLKVLRLPVEVQAHMLPLRRHGQGRQGGEAVMFVAVGDDGRLAGGSPGAAPGGDE
jgi:hypothetical protein